MIKKNHHIFGIYMETICMDEQCLKTLTVDDLKWKKKMIICNEVFLKSYDEDSDKGYILELDIKYPNDLHDLHSNLPFLTETMKINKCNKLVCNLYNEDLILFT